MSDPGRRARPDDVEREVKLEVGADFVMPALDPGPSVDVRVDLGVDLARWGASARTLEPRELDAVYFDAADLRLLDQGVTVRRRTGEGTRWTVKLPATDPASAGATARHEIDIVTDEREPTPAVVDLVAGPLAGEPLVAVARLRSRRTRVAVEARDGSRLAEIDDDRVSAWSDRGPHGLPVDDPDREPGAAFREVEIEFGAATPAELVDAIVAQFRRRGARPSDGRPKVERALAMLGMR